MRSRQTLLDIGPEDPEPVARSGEGVPRIGHERALHQPDRSVFLLDGDVLLGRVSCWWNRTAVMDERAVGVIGHFAATDGSAARQLLNRACDILSSHQRRIAVGPMDGNTWRRYRFIVDRGHEPPFALEPDNPDEWPVYWQDAGFRPMANYASAMNDRLERADQRTDETLERLEKEGIRIRPFELPRKDADLERVYQLSLASFTGNLLYTPIERAEFIGQYMAVLPYVRPDLVLLAERGPELLGFMFSIPDLLQSRRGVPVDTIILKTLAVAPAARGAGLGGALLDLAQRRAADAGFARAIHALFHDANVSGRISGRYARPIRRYQLFARTLTP